MIFRPNVDKIYIGKDNPRRKMMLTLYTIFGMFVGFEGYENGKVYVGIYTPQTEYGYVVGTEGIYLDTIFEKKF